jgi:Mrp family chromosome partitioning ATPase/capsular polysaccharide biosynthesis protein
VDGNREFAVSETPSGPDGDSTLVGGPGLVSSLWRYRLVIVAVAAFTAVAGCAAALVLPASYEAQANLYLRDPGSAEVLTLDGASPQSGDHAVFMATRAGLAASEAVYGQALQNLGRSGTPDDLRRSVDVAPSADLASLTIRTTSGDPAEAANLANAVGAAYQQVAGERMAAESDAAISRLRVVRAQREAELDSLTAQLAQSSGPAQSTLERQALHVANLIGDLQVHEDNVAAQAALYGSGVELFEQAVQPVASSQPTPLMLALLGAVVGLVAAGGWAWWAAGRDRRVEAEDDAETVLGVPLLGETPRLGGTLRDRGGPSSPLDDLDPVAAEAYHFVLTSLRHALARVGGKVVAVVSAGPGDGKTVTALNLALGARREGHEVLLVDADERTRRLSQLCRDGEQFDLISVSHDGEKCAETAVRRWPPTPQPRPRSPTRATVLQIGPSERNGHHPAMFFHSTAFDKMISFTGEPADLVLIDTPALLGVSEAVTIADHADAILMVVNRGTSLADLRRARERLGFTDTPLIGYVLNRTLAQRAYAGNSGAGGGWVAGGVLRRHGAGRLPQQARSG